jgi:hypothetical protein
MALKNIKPIKTTKKREKLTYKTRTGKTVSVKATKTAVAKKKTVVKANPKKTTKTTAVKKKPVAKAKSLKSKKAHG